MAKELLSQAIALAHAETVRPLAAAKSLNEAGTSFIVNRAKGEESLQAHEAVLKIQARTAPDSLDVARSFNGLSSVTGSQLSVTDYVLETPAKCPYCRRLIFEKTLVQTICVLVVGRFVLRYDPRDDEWTLNSYIRTVVSSAAIVPAGSNGSVDVYLRIRR